MLTMPTRPLTSSRLGYPSRARLLILNADDFGMCHAENEATIQAIKQGLAMSCTLMVPCPWALHGMKRLRENPSVPFGVHLTAVSEHKHYRWGPVTCREKVASLVDEAGCFYSEDRIPELLERVNQAELEQEFRAQIEAVLAAGLKPTHLDGHCNIHLRRDDLFQMAVGLAREYGLALRVSGGPFIEQMHQRGLPTVDHDVLDSYHLDARDKPQVYYELLQALPVGLSEWALHPAFASDELKAITPSWHVRKADLDFLVSEEARAIVEEEGITLLSYQSLQELVRDPIKPQQDDGGTYK